VRTGDRLRALRTFARYERMLAEEYDLEPSEETVRMIAALQASGRTRGKELARPGRASVVSPR
jgi:hypothetical protein